MPQVAILAELLQNYDQRILRGIAAYVRAIGNAWSLYVEEGTGPQDARPAGLERRRHDRELRRPRGGQAALKSGKPVVAYGGGAGWYREECRIPYLETDDEKIARLAADTFWNGASRTSLSAVIRPTV